MDNLKPRAGGPANFLDILEPGAGGPADFLDIGAPCRRPCQFLLLLDILETRAGGPADVLDSLEPRAGGPADFFGTPSSPTASDKRWLVNLSKTKDGD